jgi:hypothetical protein
MSDKNSTITGEGILKPDVVASDYFLLRVKDYERQYKIGWGEFLGKYESGQLDADRSNRDFVEWAFMCRTFSSELIQMEAKSPPGGGDVFSEKPENLSGFCFGLIDTCSMLKSILRKLRNSSAHAARQSALMDPTISRIRRSGR